MNLIYNPSILTCILLSVYSTSLSAQETAGIQIKNPSNEEKMTVNQTPEKNKEVVRRLYNDCLNKGNLTLLRQIISEDYTVDYKGKKVRGPSGYAETVGEVLQGFPDIRFTVEALIAEGDMVTAKWKFEGTHTGSFFGYPPSREYVINRAVAIFRFKDNKIVENWVYPDRLGILQQIGAIPEDLRSIRQSPDKSD